MQQLGHRLLRRGPCSGPDQVIHSSVALLQPFLEKYILLFVSIRGSLLRGLSKIPPRASAGLVSGCPESCCLWHGCPNPVGTLLPLGLLQPTAPLSEVQVSLVAGTWRRPAVATTGHGSPLPDGCTLTGQGLGEQPLQSPVFCPRLDPNSTVDSALSPRRPGCRALTVFSFETYFCTWCVIIGNKTQ